MEGHHLGLVQVPAPCTCIMWLTVHARCEAHQGFRKKGLPNAPTGFPTRCAMQHPPVGVSRTCAAESALPMTPCVWRGQDYRRRLNQKI